MSGGLAIVSGRGDLPRLIAQACQRSGRTYLVVVFAGTKLDWLDGHPNVEITFEKQGKLIKTIRDSGCTSITFAGAIARPHVNPLKFDGHGMKLLTKVLGAKKQGDDGSLRIILTYYEAQGFKIEAPHEILPNLVPDAGVLGKITPSEVDKSDAERAAEIVQGLGALDLGQGAVVAKGICLGLETVQGTDSMLAYVAQNRANFPAKRAKGILLKSAKPGQDLRIDLPAIGIETIRHAHAAGLSGVVITAGCVMILERAQTLAEADKLGMFIWARPVK